MTSSNYKIPFLPLAKAAAKISELSGKPHTDADILDAALAGYLTLSVQLDSLVFARSGHFQKFTEDAFFGVSHNV